MEIILNFTIHPYTTEMFTKYLRCKICKQKIPRNDWQYSVWKHSKTGKFLGRFGTCHVECLEKLVPSFTEWRKKLQQEKAKDLIDFKCVECGETQRIWKTSYAWGEMEANRKPKLCWLCSGKTKIP